jgi:hypothetical protein
VCGTSTTIFYTGITDAGPTTAPGSPIILLTSSSPISTLPPSSITSLASSSSSVNTGSQPVLSSGAIAGIAIGGFICILLAFGSSLLFRYRVKRIADPTDHRPSASTLPPNTNAHFVGNVPSKVESYLQEQSVVGGNAEELGPDDSISQFGGTTVVSPVSEALQGGHGFRPSDPPSGGFDSVQHQSPPVGFGSVPFQPPPGGSVPFQPPPGGSGSASPRPPPSTFGAMSSQVAPTEFGSIPPWHHPRL